MSWWDRKRAERDAKATGIITGADPRKSGAGMDEQAVRLKVATMLRELYDGGADPIVLIQSYAVGACWLADNSGVSRDQLVEVIRLVELKAERQMIFKPGAD